jgi:hypothetical protein
MQQDSQAPQHYGITVDKGTLRGQADEVEGTGYSVEGTIYSVQLSGAVDERWTRAFHMVQLDSTGLFRYRLDAEKKSISFQVRSKDGAARVILLLERLDQLVEDVNRSASFWGRTE